MKSSIVSTISLLKLIDYSSHKDSLFNSEDPFTELLDKP